MSDDMLSEGEFTRLVERALADPVPDHVLEAADRALELAHMDGALAELLSSELDTAGVRAGGAVEVATYRLVDADVDYTLRLELDHAEMRTVGQLFPSASGVVGVYTDSGELVDRADISAGSFTLHLERGVVHLRGEIRSGMTLAGFRTPWMTI